jgi:hypothetical protein
MPSIITAGNATNGLSMSSDGTGTLNIRTGSGTGTTAIAVDASQNVGIGTTSPRLVAGYTTVGINNTTGGFTDIFAANTRVASFGADATSTYVSAVASAPLLFSTGNTERARIDSSGNLLVGKAAISATTAGFQVNATTGSGSFGSVNSCLASATNSISTYEVYSTGAGAYRFYVGMAGTLFATSTTISGISDQRLKENVRDLDDGLEKVLALKPRKFDWKEGKGKNIKDDRGFIAQEYETVFPDMIEEWKDAPPEGEEPYKAVNANLIPTLVKAIQEQQAMIEELKAELDAVKAKVGA